jgi:hypothetical protein
MLEMFQVPLSEIPIKRIDPVQQEEFTKLTERILAAKRRSVNANTNALERKIDELVCALYELTEDEISLVGASQF